MQDKFPEFYRPTEDDFEEMWRDGLFVLDTNVLLNLYRYSSKTRDELIEIMRTLGERLWFPHQSVLEYLKNRLEAITGQKKNYSQLIKFLNETMDEVESRMPKLHRDPGLEPEKQMEKLRTAFKEMVQYLVELEENSIAVSNSLLDDPIWGELDAISEGKIGASYSEKDELEIFEEGKKRYKNEIPSGYEDSDKGTTQFGDLLLWFQIIDIAKSTKKPVIFVTDDRKGDWWRKSGGQTVGPRPELVQEIREKANVAFYMYQPHRFMEYVREYLDQEVSDEAISEVEGDQRQQASALAENYYRDHADIAKALEQYALTHNLEEEIAKIVPQEFSERERQRIVKDFTEATRALELYQQQQRLRDLVERLDR